MGAVWDVVAFDHLLVGQARAFFADASSTDGFEEGLAVLILLLHELGVVVKLIVGRADCQERGARELQHGDNGFLEQVHGDVCGLIDDDNVSAGSAGRLPRQSQHGNTHAAKQDTEVSGSQGIVTSSRGNDQRDARSTSRLA